MVNAPFLFLVVCLAIFLLGWLYPGERRYLNRNFFLASLVSAYLCFLPNFMTVTGFQGLLLLVLGAGLIGYVMGHHQEEGPERPVPRLGFTGYFILLGALVLLAVLTRLPDLGEFGLRLDERFHYRTAIGYLRTGQFHQWDFGTSTATEPYHRAFVFTWLVAQSFKVFGVSLWAGRLVSLGWGILLVLGLYGIGRRLQLTRFWMIVLLLHAVLFPYAITISRWLRMYAMFAVLFIGLTFVLYECLRVEDRSGRLVWGLALLGVGGLAVETHLLTLTLLPSVLFFLVSERFFTDDQTAPADGPLIRWVIIGLSTSILLVAVLLSPIIYREINEGIRISLSYPAGLYEDLYGYLFGPLLLVVTFLVCRREPFERYLWWVILLPVVMLTLGTDRFYQFRYLGHLSLLVLPLFVLSAQRLTARAFGRRERLMSLGVALLFLLAPAKNLASRLSYIHRGNMGFVHFRGVESPRYRPFLKQLLPVLDESHQVLVLHFYGKYIHAMRRTGAEVKAVTVPARKRVLDRLAEPRSEEIKHQWLIVPGHAKQSFGPDFFRVVEQDFRLVQPPGRHELLVYYRDLPDRPGRFLDRIPDANAR